MVRFLTTRGHEYTVSKIVGAQMGAASVPPCLIEKYDRFLSKEVVPCGTYIFTDIERLSPWELQLAAEAYRALAADRRCRVLNDPARVMARYELLRTLFETGINKFDVIRADERRWPARYPVFLRHEHDHGLPLSKLLYSQEELELELARSRHEGRPTRGMLIIEYAAEPLEGPWFRKFDTFRVGNNVFAHHTVVEDNWAVKYGNKDVKLPEEYKLYEQQFVKGNWNADLLRQVFEMASIEYGRADWAIVKGKVQIYEINTNPHLSADAGPSPTRQATLALSTQMLCDSIAALQEGTSGGRVALSGELLAKWRKRKKWYERAEWRP